MFNISLWRFICLVTALILLLGWAYTNRQFLVTNSITEVSIMGEWVRTPPYPNYEYAVQSENQLAKIVVINLVTSKEYRGRYGIPTWTRLERSITGHEYLRIPGTSRLPGRGKVLIIYGTDQNLLGSKIIDRKDFPGSPDGWCMNLERIYDIASRSDQ